MNQKEFYFKIKREWYSEHFRDYLEYEGKYAFLVGSRGSSKSHHVFLKHFVESFKPRYTNIYYGRQDETTIRKTTFNDMVLFLETTGLAEFFNYSTVANSSMIFTNKITGYTLKPLGLYDIKNIKGLPQPTHIFIDELDQTTFEAWGACNAVLRTPKAEVLQLTAMLNPVAGTWVNKTFYNETDQYTLKNNIKIGDEEIPFGSLAYSNFSTLYNNEYIDHEEYRQRIIINSNGDVSKLECDLYGRWAQLKKDNLFIFTYNQTKHLHPDLKDNPNEFIWLSFDFNVNPMTCLVFQKDIHYRWIHCIKEYRLENSDIYELCDRIKLDYKPHRIMVTGDAAGWNRSAMSKGHKNSYQIIREELKIGENQIRTPRGKPAGYISDKRTLANAILARHPNFKIGNCPYLIESFENLQANEFNKMVKTQDDMISHGVDAFCDFLYSTCKDWSKFVRL